MHACLLPAHPGACAWLPRPACLPQLKVECKPWKIELPTRKLEVRRLPRCSAMLVGPWPGRLA